MDVGRPGFGAPAPGGRCLGLVARALTPAARVGRLVGDFSQSSDPVCVSCMQDLPCREWLCEEGAR